MVKHLTAAWRERALATLMSHARERLRSSSPRTVARLAAVVAVALATANCASQQKLSSSSGGRQIDPKYGVAPSRRLYGENDAIPKGGGRNFTGRPYVVAGRTYTPRQDPRGYVREGLASWYGTAFHGRETANGEVFDRFSVAAAHPTLPLPSYARVTNLANGHSMIVRVNDRGPYHENRVMDVSQRVAEALDFRRAGTTRVRVEYVGKASLRGSDDTKLMATLRTDGRNAPMPGQGSVMFAEAGDDVPVRKPTLVAMAAPRGGEDEPEPFRPAAPAPKPMEPRTAPPVRQALAFKPADDEGEPAPQRRLATAPVMVAAVAHTSTRNLPTPVAVARAAPAAAAKAQPTTRMAQAAPRPGLARPEARPPLRLTPPPLHLAPPPLQIARATPAPPARPAAVLPRPAREADAKAAVPKASPARVAASKAAPEKLAAKAAPTTVAAKTLPKRAKVAEAR